MVIAMTNYNIVAQSHESTVVTTYQPQQKRSDAYQSEAALEAAFIGLLVELGYERLQIHTEQALIANLRKQLEVLNQITFSDGEWGRFFKEVIANSNAGIVEKTRLIQEDFVQVLRRDDGSSKNILLIDKQDIHHNRLQVLNQYTVTQAEGAKHDNRYDVTVLVNGLPLVHIELKRRGVPIREAFNQIERYQRESFWASCGLYEFVQLFVISNGTNTKYYSNTTRVNHLREQSAQKGKRGRTSHSFEFTSFWADANNQIIPDLVDFTKTFFAKHTLLNILTRYCVLTSEKLLLVMRPYQIVATERILNRIEVAHNYKRYGSVEGGGYIWHTTGSGKTLTSFKSAQLASKVDYIDKVLFVVDRKDLDYQTMKEYDRFEKGAANSNTSTAVLTRQLGDPQAKIIITTIQKLATFIKKHAGHEVFNQRIVIIFDECHRSQFGDMHLAITKYFKKYHLFGFTGTPIFAINAGTSKCVSLRTTAQAFGDQLHAYTIVDAINDKNVLPFRVDYIKTMDVPEEMDDKAVWDINREKAFMAPERIRLVTDYILSNFDRKTYRGDKSYAFKVLQNIADVASSRKAIAEIKHEQRVNGFNSIFAVSSVEAAKLYYAEFKRQMEETPQRKLKVALIYSYGANEAVTDEFPDEENSEDTSGLDASSRAFLEDAIADYNAMFKTNYSTDGDRFQNYYKDVSLRMKNKELDLLIVVNMFLTGFDATTLNTLWVDKNLKMHGLIQAYSRTNRILNSIKAFGNIVCFRNLQQATDDAIALFGDKQAGGVVLLRGYKDYYYGYTDDKGKECPGYVDMVNELLEHFPLTEERITGEARQKAFIMLFGALLRMRNLLQSFDDFAGQEVLSERELQDYLGRYQDLRDEWKQLKMANEKEDITNDVVFEIELIKQIEINIDYILMLVQKYHASHLEDKEVLVTIRRAVDSSPDLRSKKELIETFIGQLNAVDEDVIGSWQTFVRQRRNEELEQIICDERLNRDATQAFIAGALREGFVKTSGTDIVKLMPPIPRFGKQAGNRDQKKQTIIEKLKAFVEKYFGLSGVAELDEVSLEETDVTSPSPMNVPNFVYAQEERETYLMAAEKE